MCERACKGPDTQTVPPLADVLQEILLQEQELLQPGILGDEEEEEEEDEDDDDLETEGRCAQSDSLLSTSSSVFHDSTL